MPPLPASQVSTANSVVRTCPWAPDVDVSKPDVSQPAVQSLFQILQRSCAAHPESPFLGWREGSSFKFWTYAEVLEKIGVVRSALSAAGVAKGDRVGFYARNAPQWTMLQYAVMSLGAVVVPIYDTLGPNTVEYVCNHAGCKLVFVSAANFANLEGVRSEGKIPSVARVVVTGSADIVEDPEAEALAGESVVTIHKFYQSGVENGEVPAAEITLDDLLVIMYTSGTTGNPKGVMLKHHALVASVCAAYLFFDKWEQPFTEKDVYLSYLPLSHIFEQQAQALIIGRGGRIGFFSGDIKLLLSDMEILRPTTFAGVPRVFARFQQKIEEGVEAGSFIQKMVFNWAYNRQLRAEQNPGEVARSGLWDSLVFKKVRAKILPDCRLVITGSAPMSGQTNDYLKVCLQCPVVQGYGLTETVGGMVCSVPGKSKSGTCGGPLPGVEVKLADLPDMGYLNTDKPYPRGEVCVRGHIVFSGYYNNEKATQEVFDDQGFFRTGDVGQWAEDGSLQIIDRAKNLFKLSQGEYVSPEALEQEYAKAKLVGQIFVYGNSLHSTLLAVVVPDVPAATAWGATHGLQSLDSIVAAPAFKKELLEQLAEMRVKSHFKKYETIKDVIIEATELNDLGQGFTVDNNLMTPSFKLKRPQLKSKYGAALDALYEKQ